MWKLFRYTREYLKLIPFFLLICLCLVTGVKSEHVKGGKGADCSRDDQCDRNRFLECSGTSCDCRKADGITWIPEEHSCMIIEGAPCGSGKEPNCVPNSNCFDGKCECNDFFLRNGFGRCELSYGGICSVTNKCASRYLLECQYSPHNEKEGVCRCHGEGKEFVWDDQKWKCVSTANGGCDTIDHPGYWKDDRLECIENAECVERGYCRCKEGFVQTPEGTCLLEHGQRCNNSNGYVCNHHEYLICQDGRCACEFYGQMMYDNETRQCRWLVGETCDISEGDLEHTPRNFPYFRKCVKDAICNPRPKTRTGTCRCALGFETTAEQTCTKSKGHGHLCSASIDCDSKQFLECRIGEDNVGRCECTQGEMYFDGKQCRVMPGKSCSENHFCSPNSYCEGHWCVCAQGYRIDDPDCVEIHNVELSSNNNFDKFNFPSGKNVPLSPVELCEEVWGSMEWQKCQCQILHESRIWSSEKHTCVALVGSNCKNDEDCTDHALCDSEDKTCQCIHSAHTTSNRTCLRKSTPSTHEHHDHQDHDEYDCTERMHTLKSVTVDVGDYQYLSGANVQFPSGYAFGFRLTVGILVITTQYIGC